MPKSQAKSSTTNMTTLSTYDVAQSFNKTISDSESLSNVGNVTLATESPLMSVGIVAVALVLFAFVRKIK